MSKENQPQAKPSRDVVVANDNEFAVNLLEQLQWMGPKRLIEVRAFFTQAFLTQTEEEIFNSSNYRLEWSDNVYYINELCSCVEKYSDEQLKNAIDHSVKILKTVKEVSNG